MSPLLRVMTIPMLLIAGGCWVDGDPAVVERAETPTGVYPTPEAAGIDDPDEAASDEARNHETAGDRFDEAVEHSSETPSGEQQPALPIE
jgi:hypothetical protein